MKLRKQSSCPICYSLDIFGDKWTLLVIRDILVKQKTHYRDFLAAREGISTNILADRLKALVEQGLLTREEDPDNGTQAIYRPTKKGRSLLPVLDAMKDWALANAPEHVVPPLPLSAEASPTRSKRKSRRT